MRGLESPEPLGDSDGFHMTPVNGGDFLPTTKETLRHGLGLTDPNTWETRSREGLASALPVFIVPSTAPDFYGRLADKSLALALAGSVYNERESHRAQQNPSEVIDAKLKILGLNALGIAMANSPEIEEALREADPSIFVDHMPAAINLMSQPRQERDLVLDDLHQHRSLRGMFMGISAICSEAVDAIKEPEKLTGKSSIVWGNRQSIDNQADREKGIIIAGGWDTLLVATASYLGYLIQPGKEVKPGYEGREREVINLRNIEPTEEITKPAIPTDLHQLLQEKTPVILGIDIAQGRTVATSNSRPALETLEEQSPVIDAIRKAVISRVGTSLGISEQGVIDGSNAVALAFSNATSQELIDTLESLDLLDPKGLCDSERLKKCASVACERAGEIVELIAQTNQDLTRGTTDLKSKKRIIDPKNPEEMIYEVPLLASICQTINIDVRNYAHREVQSDAGKFNGYLAASYAFIEIIYELLNTIPHPITIKKAA